MPDTCASYTLDRSRQSDQKVSGRVGFDFLLMTSEDRSFSRVSKYKRKLRSEMPLALFVRMVKKAKSARIGRVLGLKFAMKLMSGDCFEQV